MSSLSEMFHVSTRQTPPDHSPDRPHAELGWTIDQVVARYGKTHFMESEPILQSEDFRIDEDLRQGFAAANAHRKKSCIVGHIDRWGTDFTMTADFNEDGRLMEMTWWPTEGALATAHTFSSIEKEIHEKAGVAEKDVDGDHVFLMWNADDTQQALWADISGQSVENLFYKAEFTGYANE